MEHLEGVRIGQVRRLMGDVAVISIGCSLKREINCKSVHTAYKSESMAYKPRVQISTWHFFLG